MGFLLGRSRLRLPINLPPTPKNRTKTLHTLSLACGLIGRLRFRWVRRWRWVRGWVPCGRIGRLADTGGAAGLAHQAIENRELLFRHARVADHGDEKTLLPL